MTDEELIKKYISIDKQEEALSKLKTGYPVQYIIGNVEFLNTIIKVNENVLIPRFETEYLVQKTINYLHKLNLINPHILEIGTGSGCISIALKKNIPSSITAFDINDKAIKIAKENALDNHVTINFITKDIHKYKSHLLYDVIISNPPYVPYNSPVDKKIKYEPKDAIYAQDNGIYFYKVIFNKIQHNLNKTYLIAFEIGDKEGYQIKKLAKQYLPNSYISIEKDLNNYERYFFISNQNIF